MSKPCAKCKKSVYPVEELKCLDKIWHKTCFRCSECGMVLNMKNYKGFDKLPYCHAHYPKTKFTVVAQTPEGSRIAANTKLQSQVTYHNEFEKAKGKCIAVTDDPEMQRVLKNQQNVSLVQYHKDFEDNIKGTKIQVAEDPELARLKANTQQSSNIDYHGLRQKHDEMEQRRAYVPDSDNKPVERRAPGSITHDAEVNPSPYQARSQSNSTMYGQQGKVQTTEQRRVGSINDYDPMNEHHGSMTQGYVPQSTTRQSQQWEETYPEPTSPHSPKSPKDDVFSKEPQQGYPTQPQPQVPAQPHQPPQQHQQQQQPPPQQQQQQPPPQQQPARKMGAVYLALYDYEAQDDDEVGFKDGDHIIDCEPIDDGWMFGTVKRTGKRGMLPANYVDRVQ